MLMLDQYWTHSVITVRNCMWFGHINTSFGMVGTYYLVAWNSFGVI